MERAVQGGLGRWQGELVSDIGVDEKTFGQGQSYLIPVNDFGSGTGTVLTEDRKRSSLDGSEKR